MTAFILRLPFHYGGAITGAIASQITSLAIVYSAFYSGADQRKTSKLRVTGLCAGNSPGNGEFPHKWPVTRKMFPFDDVIVYSDIPCRWHLHILTSQICLPWYNPVLWWLITYWTTLLPVIHNLLLTNKTHLNKFPARVHEKEDIFLLFAETLFALNIT